MTIMSVARFPGRHWAPSQDQSNLAALADPILSVITRAGDVYFTKRMARRRLLWKYSRPIRLRRMDPSLGDHPIIAGM